MGLNECKAQDKKLGDCLGQLERKVGEVVEGNRVLSQQVQGVGQQLQTLQQELQGFEGRLEEKINYLFHPVSLQAPIYYTSGVPVGAEDTAGSLTSWGSGGDQGFVGFPPRTPGGDTGSCLGQL